MSFIGGWRVGGWRGGQWEGWAVGGVGGGRWAVGVGGQAKGGLSLPIRPPTAVLCPQQVTDICTTHRMGQDRHCQQLDNTPTLISAPQWSHRPCNGPMRPYRVGKQPSVEADLAMYSHTVDVSRQYMSVSLILGCKMDFSSCTIRAGFHKSSHILL